MDNDAQDYLFDLQGYLVLKNAISAADLREMNQWIDGHESYIEEPWSTDGDPKKKGRWIGHIGTHTYNEENGVNFQSIIEGGPVFEKLISQELLQRLTPERRAIIVPNAPRRPPSFPTSPK